MENDGMMKEYFETLTQIAEIMDSKGYYTHNNGKKYTNIMEFIEDSNQRIWALSDIKENDGK